MERKLDMIDKKNVRNIKNYLKKTKTIADIITLQEVQEKESTKSVLVNKINYGVVYKNRYNSLSVQGMEMNQN